MHDAVGVENGGTGSDLPEQGETNPDPKRPSGETIAEAAAFGPRHHDVRPPVGQLANRVHPYETLVVQPPQQPPLIQKPLADSEIMAPILGQHLDRDAGTERGIESQPHGGE